MAYIRLEGEMGTKVLLYREEYIFYKNNADSK